MNKVFLVGRLTADPIINTVPGQTDRNGQPVKRAFFNIAIDRNYKKADGTRDADFIPVTAWRGLATFAEQYLKKGVKIVLDGSIRTSLRQNPQTGQNERMWNVQADNIEFAESKGVNDARRATTPQPQTAPQTTAPQPAPAPQPQYAQAPQYQQPAPAPQPAPQQTYQQPQQQTDQEGFMQIPDVMDENIPFI